MLTDPFLNNRFPSHRKLKNTDMAKFWRASHTNVNNTINTANARFKANTDGMPVFLAQRFDGNYQLYGRILTSTGISAVTSGNIVNVLSFITIAARRKINFVNTRYGRDYLILDTISGILTNESRYGFLYMDNNILKFLASASFAWSGANQPLDFDMTLYVQPY